MNLQAGVQEWQLAEDTCEQAQDAGQYGPSVQLDHGALLAVTGRDQQATEVLKTVADLATPGSSIAPLHARVLLSYLALCAGDRPGISELLRQAKQSGDKIRNEAEQQFHEAMLLLLASDEPDLRNALRYVDRALRGFPGQPVIEWVSASLNCAAGEVRSRK